MGGSSDSQPDAPPDAMFQVCPSAFLEVSPKAPAASDPSQGGAARRGAWATGLTSPAQVRVVNAGNSCYLDSVLFAMFAMPSQLDTLLSKPLASPATLLNAR